jgi:23S rRNA (adenine2030-N6)-methyltransferase
VNYRHAYHAGNFADVFKHVLLSRIISYLKLKDAAFRVVDTHAGPGLYDLSSIEAGKTGEWILGAGRVAAARFSEAAAELMQPYLSVLAKWKTDGTLSAYPGSPLIARNLMRRQDRLSACELHAEDFGALQTLFTGDWQVRTMNIDGWLIPGAHLPPKEKRGVVLIDPPFETEGEFSRLADALARGVARWPGGIFALWYPLKHEAQVAQFVTGLAASGIGRLMQAEIWVRGPSRDPLFRGCGMIIRNPPYVLEAELRTLLPELSECLAVESGAGWRIEAIAGE